VESDKYCPYCACDLRATPPAPVDPAAAPASQGTLGPTKV
jgi:hypothetical protein